MLNVIEYGKDEYSFPALLVLGCFDAIHLGHRELIKKAKLQAKINGLDLGVMMFRDGKGGALVYSFEERLKLLEGLGVKFVLAIDFNEEFMATAPLDFLATIENNINVKAYMSGKDFRFGAKAKGKASTLKSYAEDDENGVWYMSVKDVMCDGEKVSTTLIKSCLDCGDIEKADKLLGSDFNVTGEVVHGAGRGSEQVGFPTINIAYPAAKYPVKSGVYKVYSVIDGVKYYGIANYGNCPTFGDDRIALEVYFDGFSGDLYGATVTVYFLSYIRDIVAFASVEELTAQLNRDIEFIRGSDAPSQIAAEDKPSAAAETAPAETLVVEEPAPAETTAVEEPVHAETVVVEETAHAETVVVEETAPAEQTEVGGEAAPEAKDSEEQMSEEEVCVEQTEQLTETQAEEQSEASCGEINAAENAEANEEIAQVQEEQPEELTEEELSEGQPECCVANVPGECPAEEVEGDGFDDPVEESAAEGGEGDRLD